MELRILQITLILLLAEVSHQTGNNKQHFLFKKLPAVAIPRSYTHVRIPFPLKPLLSNIDNAIAVIQKERLPENNKDNKFLEMSNIIYEDTLRRLQQIKVEAMEIVQKMPSVHRSKRFLDILGFFTGTAALGMAFYNSHSITKLNEKIQDMGNKHNQLVDITHIHQQHLEKLEASVANITEYWISYFEYNPTTLYLHMSEIVQDFQKKTNIMADLLEHGINGRLAPSGLPARVLESVSSFLKVNAEKLKLISAAAAPLDLLHMETSYLYSPENYTLTIILHVPMFDATFEAYQIQPIPLNYQEKNNYLIPDVGEENVLVIRNENYYYLTSAHELRACTMMGGVHICNQRGEFLTNLEDTCLGAIYNLNEEKVKEICRFKLDTIKEFTIEVEANTFLVITPTQFRTTMRCKDGSTHPVVITNLMKLYVPPECAVSLKAHIVIGKNEELTIDEKPLHLEWDINLDNLTHAFNVPKELLDSRNQMEQLRKNLTNLQDFGSLKYGSTFSQDPLTAALICAGVALGIVALAIHLYCFIKKNHKGKNVQSLEYGKQLAMNPIIITAP